MSYVSKLLPKFSVLYYYEIKFSTKIELPYFINVKFKKCMHFEDQYTYIGQLQVGHQG